MLSSKALTVIPAPRCAIVGLHIQPPGSGSAAKSPIPPSVVVPPQRTPQPQPGAVTPAQPVRHRPCTSAHSVVCSRADPTQLKFIQLQHTAIGCPVLQLDVLSSHIMRGMTAMSRKLPFTRECSGRQLWWWCSSSQQLSARSNCPACWAIRRLGSLCTHATAFQCAQCRLEHRQLAQESTATQVLSVNTRESDARRGHATWSTG
jgi:hypothetical protein